MGEINLLHYNEYLDSMVAFIDILGFDKEVKSINSEEDFVKIATVLSYLKETEKKLNAEKTLLKDFNMTAISDSIIVSMPYRSFGCAMNLIVILHKIQYEVLTDYKKILRGYLTKGRVYHKENIIFGEGYSKAYTNEKESGYAPRIVIDPILIKDGREEINNYSDDRSTADNIFNYVLEDPCDGLFFIDYLKPVGMPKKQYSKDKIIKDRREIISFINQNIEKYKNDVKILSKYNWLKNYFSKTENYFI